METTDPNTLTLYDSSKREMLHPQEEHLPRLRVNILWWPNLQVYVKSDHDADIILNILTTSDRRIQMLIQQHMYFILVSPNDRYKLNT